jgi:MoxR-like ATPase
MSKAVARLRGRDYAVPGDVREVFPHALSHRILISPRAQAQNKSSEQLLREILETTPVPKLR